MDSQLLLKGETSLMTKTIVSCMLTGIISVVISYYINVHLSNIRKKNELVLDQLKDYSKKLSLLAEKWQEFDEIMADWNRARAEGIAQITLRKTMMQIGNIEQCFADYRSSIHSTEKIIGTYFGNGDAFSKSVYSMRVTKNDQYAEADFFNVTKNDVQSYPKDEAGNQDARYAVVTLNRVYGTYMEIYKYRVQTKLTVAQAYIDQEIQVVMDNISKHRFSRRK